MPLARLGQDWACLIPGLEAYSSQSETQSQFRSWDFTLRHPSTHFP
jgi:hypothetical protein